MTSWRVRATWPRLLAAALSLSLPIFGSPGAAATAPPLSDAPPVLDEFGKRLLDRSLPQAERLQLIELMGAWATDQVRTPLLATLGDPLPSIRTAAVRALGWKGNREAVAALRERVEAPGEVTAVKVAALDSLGRIGDESGRTAVLAKSQDPDSKIRTAALSALTFGNLASPSDRIPLLRQVAEDTGLDLLMRCQAIQALGVSKDTGAADLLLRLLEREPPITMPGLKDQLTQQEIMAVRYREARDVRAWAARVLGVIEARAALPLLLKTAEDPNDFFLRVFSVETLGAWKAAEAIPVLVRRLDDPFEYTRLAALSALAALGDRSVVDPVLARLSDKVPSVRQQAVMTLVALGDPRARPPLEALQQREVEPAVQEALEKALAQLPR
ncbi:MAG TPA: HEAT repeat domain-containing protein [Methylomirabilota bacterium]|jgi:HEAT repeat protein|nr:HEAT repeat domain-containing protein [Methylomirabilota bacterium]